MRKSDLNKVVFYSKEDLAAGHHLNKGESILRANIKSNYNDINEILELHNIKKYIDNEVFLKKWTPEDILEFKTKANDYGKIIGKFLSNINDSNIISIYNLVLRDYIKSFWELISQQGVFKRISKESLKKILDDEPHTIHSILEFRNIVEKHNTTIKESLITYPKTAEILLSIYEAKKNPRQSKKFLPKSLSIDNKENIIQDYLSSDKTNLNYVGLILNSRNTTDFKISDKTRLKAKRLYQKETEEFLNKGNGGLKYGVSIGFLENMTEPMKSRVDDDLIIHYSYSLDYIKKNNSPYFLFQYFKYVFGYLDNQNRIELVSTDSKMDSLEKLMGIRSQNEYQYGNSFSISEMTSNAQIQSYSLTIKNLNTSLEEIINLVFTSIFQEKYSFAENARFSLSTAKTYFEKVRFLAAEFESALKQYKLYVEDGNIDFELLQISSSPSSIKSIPSLNSKKYIYFNNDNLILKNCTNLFFSDQAHLTYIEPFKNDYTTFFDLLANEDVELKKYKEHQKPSLNYLIENDFIKEDKDGFIQIINPARLLILKDLYDNEVGSYYHYPLDFQEEATKMASEKIIKFESTLFTKTEQAYFNFFLNKKEFTNGLDLRNSYSHGTQANPDETEKHEFAYYIYLKLIFLTLLKIDDDLRIHSRNTSK